LTLNQTDNNSRTLNSSGSITTNVTSEKDIQINSVEVVAAILVILGTLIGNHLVFFAFINNLKMRTVTNTMVVNMCIVDIMSVLGDIPFYLVPSIHPELSNQYVFCRVSMFMYNFSTVASILSMVGIAVDRYLNLVQTSLRRLCNKKAQVIISLVWLQALIAALPWDLLSPSSRSPDLTLWICKHYPYAYNPGMDILGLSIFLKVLCVIIPYLVIFWVFGRVLQSARRMIEVDDPSVISRSKTERFAVHSYARSSVTAVFLFSIYLIFTTPFFLSAVYTSFSEYTNISSAVAFSVYYLFRLKGTFLPIMYLLRNRIVIIYLQRKLKYFYGKQEYSTQTINSMRFRGNNSSGPSRTKREYQSQAMKGAARWRKFYTNDAKKDLRSSFTDLSSFHNENEGYSKVVLERWTKPITVKEAKNTNETLQETKKDVKASDKTAGTQQAVHLQSFTAETTGNQTENMVCTETSMEIETPVNIESNVQHK
jgi:hypothetical protein